MCHSYTEAFERLLSGTMAKSKGKAQKQKNVFHVANSKSVKVKNKAKSVKTNLKKITVTKEKVSTVNTAFTGLHKEVAQLKKDRSSKPKNQIPKKTLNAPADVDNAADLFSQL
ncbi:ribosomal biogenesis factor isoform X1 [Spea bombifrons]|uniref:ribosomal biogenesis factor isoform X1 n=2 Tax=Spea bombifrons TaxID=233779 RepID=UPI00234B91D6|nr:ribosomal biogenesis factor isoform X1 [Spea bombifrons]